MIICISTRIAQHGILCCEQWNFDIKKQLSQSITVKLRVAGAKPYAIHIAVIVADYNMLPYNVCKYCHIQCRIMSKMCVVYEYYCKHYIYRETKCC